MNETQRFSYGDLDVLPQRFWEKTVFVHSGCWEWVGAKNVDGYGRFRVGIPIKQVHRVSYEAFIGPIEEGLVVDHLCRVRNCVNPAHLEPVTVKENAVRSANGYQFKGYVCKHGHDVSAPEDRRGTKGHHQCKKCGEAWDLLLREAREKLGITQREYAKQYGRTRQVAERVIRGGLV